MTRVRLSEALGRVARVAVLVEADRHIAADLAEGFLQGLLIKLVRGERKARRHHSAADVDAHGGGDDGALRGNDRAHGRADTEVHVRHGRHVVVHDRQARDVHELRARGGSISPV